MTEESSYSRKEERRQERLRKKEELLNSSSFRLLEVISKFTDTYHLDPILGLIPGIGDMLTSLCSLPFIYYSIAKVKSIPLTLAVTLNIVVDTVLGMLPFYVGNVLDFFYRSNKKNLDLIVKYVNEDEAMVRKVHGQAVMSAIAIVLLIVAGVLLIRWIVSIFQ